MREFHIIAGVLALLAGFVAAFAAKGSRLHRRAGTGFVVAMTAMTTSAIVSAGLLRPNAGNVVAGCFAFYLTATAWLTVRRVPHQRGVLAALALIAIAVGISGVAMGTDLLGRRVLPDGIPGHPLLAFGVIASLSALSDLRLLGGRVLEGPQRLVRHLWRMLLGLWIATGSAFLGQAQFLPRVVVDNLLHLVPVLVVTVLLVYWPIRMARQRRRVARARDARPASSMQAA